MGRPECTVRWPRRIARETLRFRPAFLTSFFLSLSTTVSLLLLSAMAYTRYQVASSSSPSRNQWFFAWLGRHKVAAALVPWLIGIVFTSLHFVDPKAGLQLVSYFDPISKLTILLPASSSALSFYIQTALAAGVSVLTLIFSVCAWRKIDENAKAVRKKGMIRYSCIPTSCHIPRSPISRCSRDRDQISRYSIHVSCPPHSQDFCP